VGRIRRWQRCVALVLALLLLGLCVVEAADSPGLFSRLKDKAQQKIDDLQSREWWTIKGAGKVAGFVAGKAAGALGAAAGAVIGLTCGGPVGAGVGAMIGYRIVDTVVKTFVRPVGELVAKRFIDHQEVGWSDVKEAFHGLDKRALTAESIGAVLGDFIGGTRGVAAGLALTAGMGTLAIPIIGAVSAGYLGRKLGSMIGRWLGRAVLRRAGRYSVQAWDALMAPKEPPVPGSTEERAALTTSSKPGTTAYAPNRLPAAPVSSAVAEALTAYQQAYQAYVAAVNDPALAESEQTRRRVAFQKAKAEYETAIKPIP
jgi:outer membrane lipoprotein SlyB